MNKGSPEDPTAVPSQYEVVVRGRVMSVQHVRRFLFLNYTEVELEVSEPDRKRLSEMQDISGFDGGAWDVSQTLFVRLNPNQRVTIGEDAHLSVIVKSEASATIWTARGYTTRFAQESVLYPETAKPAA
ncbi:MAG: hypothetical protein V4682_00815 [Patescibacteria group bacterium]